MARRECRNCAGTVSALVVSLPECGSCPTNLPKMPSTGQRAANAARRLSQILLPELLRSRPPMTSTWATASTAGRGPCYRRHRVATPAALR